MKWLLILLSVFALHCSFPQKTSAVPKSQAAVLPRLKCASYLPHIKRSLCEGIIGNVVMSLPSVNDPATTPNMLRFSVKTERYDYRPYKADAGKDDCKGICTAYGTGTILAPGIVLTNEHAVRNAVYMNILIPILDERGVFKEYSQEILMHTVLTGSPDYAFLVVANKEDLALFPKDSIKIGFKTKPPTNLQLWHFGKTTGPQIGVVLPESSNKCAEIESRLPMNIRIEAGDSGGGIFYGDTYVGYVMKFNNEVCQGNVTQALHDIGLRWE